ncbi:MAG: hypothetical protein HQL28_07220, partial [Candidatus Omnitrophica bacterium]|nr:hypothetical protein [Candidatus Omnitrophota bacterium]
MLYLDQDVTAVVSGTGNITSYFGRLGADDLTLAVSDNIEYGVALEFKGVGGPRVNAIWQEMTKADQENSREYVDKLKLVKVATDTPEYVNIEKDGRYRSFALQKSADETCKIFEYRHCKWLDNMDDGIFMIPYQLVNRNFAPEFIGTARYSSEKKAQGIQKELYEAGAALNVLILNVVPLDRDKNKIEHGMALRMRIGGINRRNDADFFKVSNDNEAARLRAKIRNAVYGTKETFFYNMGRNTMACLRKNIALFMEELRTGKDICEYGRLADLAEVKNVSKEKQKNKENEQIELIARWLDLMLEVNISLAGMSGADGLLGDYLLGLFNNNEDHVAKVVEAWGMTQKGEINVDVKNVEKLARTYAEIVYRKWVEFGCGTEKVSEVPGNYNGPSAYPRSNLDLLAEEAETLTAALGMPASAQVAPSSPAPVLAQMAPERIKANISEAERIVANIDKWQNGEDLDEFGKQAALLESRKDYLNDIKEIYFDEPDVNRRLIYLRVLTMTKTGISIISSDKRFGEERLQEFVNAYFLNIIKFLVMQKVYAFRENQYKVGRTINGRNPETYGWTGAAERYAGNVIRANIKDLVTYFRDNGIESISANKLRPLINTDLFFVDPDGNITVNIDLENAAYRG